MMKSDCNLTKIELARRIYVLDGYKRLFVFMTGKGIVWGN